MPTAIFITVVFLYSLISHRLERTVITAPIVFTAAGLLIFLMPPWLSAFDLDRKAFLLSAELGLVMTLFTDGTRINVQVKGNRHLPVRLLSAGMLLSIPLGALGALVVVRGLSFGVCVLDTVCREASVMLYEFGGQWKTSAQ